MRAREFLFMIGLQLMLSGIVAESQAGDDFDKFLKPLIIKNCLRCHGGKKVNGEVNFKKVTTATQFLAKPELIQEMIEVVGANDMPPEGEPELAPEVRTKLLATLKVMLRESTSGNAKKQIQIRRLNRFQYNNSVKDLFQLQLNVFKLPEKLMTRRRNYLHSVPGRMPNKVQVVCLSLKPEGGMSEVSAFPKDLRAAHGFDNQANQLTLSPLLLDAFLKLSVSILNSPDFNHDTVGIWNDLFAEPPAGTDLEAEIRNRLAPFLRRAFRRSVERDTLERYSAYAKSRLRRGQSFTDCMKQVASAALSSPLFLYRHGSVDGEEQFELASNLSSFLWGSSPALALLPLAERAQPASTGA